MGEAGAKKPQLTGPLFRLSEDNITDILRLPAKSVLRCGAVCRAWRGITTDPSFLAAHARSRPGDILYTYEYRPPPIHGWPLDPHHTVEIGLRFLPVSSGEEIPRRLIRYRKRLLWFLLASSNGILLFRRDEGYYFLCNPVTRLWADLPRIPRAHQPQQDGHYYVSVNYIDTGPVLCRRSLTSTGTWCILATGAAEPRPIDTHAAEAAGITELVPCLRTSVSMHVALHGRLHWPPHQASSAMGTTTTEMVLFDMDGLLVAADFGKEAHIDLWFLDDYSSRRWELRHRVATPPLEPKDLLSVAAAGDGEGNIMLGPDWGLVVYNVERKTVKTVDPVATLERPDVVLSRHVFKESLQQHSFFTAQPNVHLASKVHF
uniref:F-box domain-containing protein n=1 Tax=Setaria viridis TaxID=4556 RepID=A0A4U6W6I5_SETVI|nr:hypothetical protein SEVIR_2G436000v2 [Setaria viridis]